MTQGALFSARKGLSLGFSLLIGLGGVLLGALVGHAFSARRWRMEARKDAYIRFADAADAFVETIWQYRNLSETLGRPSSYEQLRSRRLNLRPAWYQLRLVAPTRLAWLADRIWTDADELCRRVDDPLAKAQGEPPIASEEFAELHKAAGPFYEDVDAFIELARLDLTMDWRSAQVARATSDRVRRMRWTRPGRTT